MSVPVHMITGGAGFIGSNLARALLQRPSLNLILVDDLSNGGLDLLQDVLDNSRVQFRQLDCADGGALTAAVDGAGGALTDVWHLAANSDIPAGVADPVVDQSRTFQTTVGVLEMMRALAVPTLHFASSSAIYGDLGETLIHEDVGPLLPISNYGAMKLASEAQISAAVEAFLPRANIFRFPNVIGVPATHGVILDFVRKLQLTPGDLPVLGDGSQRKAYLHVEDLLSAMFHIEGLAGRRVVFNIGPVDDGVTVRFIAEQVRDRVSPEATISFGHGDRGWVGDVPRFRYSIERLLSTGWTPRWSSQEAVTRAVDEIAHQVFRR